MEKHRLCLVLCRTREVVVHNILRVYEVTEKSNLTLVIIGALFDLRRAPPPLPQVAPAHWSTSILSISDLQAQGQAVVLPGHDVPYTA